MFLPRFSGNDDDNPTSWIFRAELYFTYLGFDEKHWLPLPSFYLDGEALTWFNWLFHNKLFLDWKHFKDRFAQRFQQQTNRDVLGCLSNSSQVHFDSVNSVPIVSQSAVVPPFPTPSHFPKSSPSASAYDTGSSQAVHVFDKLPMKYKYVESVSLITKNNVEVEDTETPRLENANSVEANLVHEPSPIIEDQVFDEISHTTVSSNIDDLTAIVHDVEHSVTTVAKVYSASFYKDIKVPLVVLYDMEGSNTDEEKNSQDNVAWFEKFPPLNISELLVAFACQVTVMSNASSRLAEIEYPFADTLWLRTIPCWHNSLDEICRGNQNKVFLCLDFRLRKCSWVDTGQKCNLSSFLLSNPRGCASEEKIQKVLQAIYVSSSTHSPYIQVVRLIVAMFGLAHKARLPSPYIVFDPGPYLDYESSYAIYSTFGDRESVEEGVVTVLLKRPEAEFHIGQVLSVQIGFIADDCNRYGTYLYCHIGTCTYSHLESDVILWVVPFCNSEDNCLDTGQDDFGCASIANESLNTVSNTCELFDAVAKRRIGYTAQLYDWGYVGGVEIDIQSYGAFNNSYATYKLPGEFIENSLMCLYNGVTNILGQFNTSVIQSDSAYTPHNILFFSLGHVTLLDWLKWSGSTSLRALPHSTPTVKRKEADRGEVVGKSIIISLEWKLEYYDASVLKIPTLVQVTSFMASPVDIYTNFEAMAHVKASCYDSPSSNIISSTLLYSGYFNNSREPMILVSYLKSIWFLLLRGLNNSKNPCFLKHLLQPLPHASILKRHFLRVADNYIVYNWWIHLGLNVYKPQDDPKPFILRLQKIHITGHKALQCNTYITFLELQCKELLQHKEMGNSWIHGSTCWISLTMWLAIHYSFSFLALNLEDKVLIEGGSIVVNRVGSVRAYGLELVKETDLVGIIGPSKMLESFVWDPGPINIWLKGRMSWKEGLCILKKMFVLSSSSRI
ncbi:hypothetical protein MTR67_053531 [Solanum verrucosum]|uniref:Uncharacterized protein n=1 Tax=Solanum verrucosum TaxID=315347 RepID=A0AAF0VAZ1_SOLVR|nr:hypothetical protein MTR67_053531 [Solanum verrucosum]